MFQFPALSSPQALSVTEQEKIRSEILLSVDYLTSHHVTAEDFEGTSGALIRTIDGVRYKIIWQTQNVGWYATDGTVSGDSASHHEFPETEWNVAADFEIQVHSFIFDITHDPLETTNLMANHSTAFLDEASLTRVKTLLGQRYCEFYYLSRSAVYKNKMATAKNVFRAHDNFVT